MLIRCRLSLLSSFYIAFKKCRLITCLTFLHFLVLMSTSYPVKSFGQTDADLESYLDRPQISEIASEQHQLGENWEKMKSAGFVFVAQILELYQGADIYFLARDAEHLHDIAKLATANTEQERKIHLINVSTTNMHDSHLLSYLAENGISVESLQQDKKIVFIDTGFTGRISEHIKNLFPESLHQNIVTHLIVSSVDSFASSRAFLWHLNKAINRVDPVYFAGTIKDQYEAAPHFFDRSFKYQFVNQRWHPVSSAKRQSDGIVSKQIAFQQMQDLKAYWQKPRVQQEFKWHRLIVRRMIHILTDDRLSKSDRVLALQQLLTKYGTSYKGLLEAHLKDLLQALPIAGKQLKVEGSDLNFLSSIEYKKTSISDEKKIFTEIEILGLIEDQKWQKVEGQISQLDSAGKIRMVNELFKKPASSELDRLLGQIIATSDEAMLFHLSKSIFSQPQNAQRSDLLVSLIKKAKLLHVGLIKKNIIPMLDPNAQWVRTINQALQIGDLSERERFLKSEMPVGQKLRCDGLLL